MRPILFYKLKLRNAQRYNIIKVTLDVLAGCGSDEINLCCLSTKFYFSLPLSTDYTVIYKGWHAQDVGVAIVTLYGRVPTLLEEGVKRELVYIISRGLLQQLDYRNHFPQVDFLRA